MIYISLITILTLTFFLIYKISFKFNFLDIPNDIKIHKKETPNVGGLAIIPYVFLLIYFFNLDTVIVKTLYILLIVVLIGFIDDIKNINPILKLILLFIPIFVFTHNIDQVYSLGNYGDYIINLGSYGFIFTILCIFLLTNAYNYIDGLDGLLGTNLIIILFFLYYLSSDNKDIYIALILFLFVYLLFNFNVLKIFPKQFIGDSGSLGFGFIISSLLVLFSQSMDNIHPSTIIWTVAFVVYEFLSINIIRINKKKKYI